MIEAAPTTPQTASPARPGAVVYETPTVEKLAFGRRMRLAREIAGLSLTDAAKAMGYAQPVQLSYMETGHRLPPLKVVMQAAELYGCTMDYLCGFAADADRDPAVGAQAMIAARVTAEVRTLISRATQAGIDVVRTLQPDAGRIARLACAAIEAAGALEVLRKSHPEFDEMHAGARLAAKLGIGAELAREHVAAVERAKRSSAAGMAELALASGSVGYDDGAPLGFALTALKALDPGPRIEDGEDE